MGCAADGHEARRLVRRVLLGADGVAVRAGGHEPDLDGLRGRADRHREDPSVAPSGDLPAGGRAAHTRRVAARRPARDPGPFHSRCRADDWDGADALLDQASHRSTSVVGAQSPPDRADCEVVTTAGSYVTCPGPVETLGCGALPPSTAMLVPGRRPRAEGRSSAMTLRCRPRIARRAPAAHRPALPAHGGDVTPTTPAQHGVLLLFCPDTPGIV